MFMNIFHRSVAFAVLLVSLATTSCVAAAAGDPQVAEHAILQRDTVIVGADLVRLGDLFLNISNAKAETPVAYAPAPGRRAVFDARWLHRVAHRHGLNWSPAGTHDQVMVERESTVIGREDVEQQILAALAERGVDTGQAKIQLSNRMFRLHLPANVEPELNVEDVAFDARRGHFDAMLTVSADGAAQQRVRVTGQLHEMVDIPVLTRRIAAGEVLTLDDIRWISVRGETLQKQSILAAEDLVGLTPRRPLRPGVPINAADVQRPVMVSKGDLVVIALQTPQMLLSARGQALSNGSKGDVIRIANIQSRQIVEAMVTGPSQATVEVSSTAPLR
jgi:flagella basal body P-ring formation protein FlgA